MTLLITSERIRLRDIALTDAPVMQQILDDESISRNTLSIPSPLPPDWALEWITMLQAEKADGHLQSFAIESIVDKQVVGVVSLLDINQQHRRAELAYLIGHAFRRQGYAAAAAALAIDYGFGQLNLARIYAYHLAHNQPSGGVLKKLGFIHEGCLRKHILKDGLFLDSDIYGLLRKVKGS